MMNGDEDNENGGDGHSGEEEIQQKRATTTATRNGLDEKRLTTADDYPEKVQNQQQKPTIKEIRNSSSSDLMMGVGPLPAAAANADQSRGNSEEEEEYQKMNETNNIVSVSKQSKEDVAPASQMNLGLATATATEEDMMHAKQQVFAHQKEFDQSPLPKKKKKKKKLLKNPSCSSYFDYTNNEEPRQQLLPTNFKPTAGMAGCFNNGVIQQQQPGGYPVPSLAFANDDLPAEQEEQTTIMDIVAKRCSLLASENIVDGEEIAATASQTPAFASAAGFPDDPTTTKTTIEELTIMEIVEKRASRDTTRALSPPTLSREPPVNNRAAIQPGAFAVAPGNILRTLDSITNYDATTTTTTAPDTREEEGHPPSPRAMVSSSSTDFESLATNNSSNRLVEALPVDDSNLHNSTRMLAQPVHKDSFTDQAARKSKDKEHKRFASCVVSVACLCLIVSLVVGLWINKESSDALPDNNDTPTPSPTTRPLPPMENLELLYDELPEKTKESLNSSHDSPQYQAWQWLLNHPHISTMKEWRKKQIFAMATFFYSLEGPSWPDQTPNWDRWMDVSTSECSWVVSADEVVFFHQQTSRVFGPKAYEPNDLRPCNEDGQLQALYVHQLFLPANVKPSIPQEIELLTSLKILAIAFSQISVKLVDFLVPELVVLPKLEKLAFQGSGLSGTIPKQLGKMTGLRHLTIGSNRLTGTIPPEISKMTLLEHILLDDMRGIVGVLPSELGLMTRLTGLEIARNSLSGNIPSELGLLTSMQRLALDGNMFSGSLPGHLWELSQMEMLSLSNMPTLYGRIPSELVMMPKLTTLSLSGSPHLSGTIPDQACLLVEELNFDCSNLLCGCGCLCAGSINKTNLH